MTKRDVEMIAKGFYEDRIVPSTEEEYAQVDMWLSLRESIMTVISISNEDFDRSGFIRISERGK